MTTIRHRVFINNSDVKIERATGRRYHIRLWRSFMGGFRGGTEGIAATPCWIFKIHPGAYYLSNPWQWSLDRGRAGRPDHQANTPCSFPAAMWVLLTPFVINKRKKDEGDKATGLMTLPTQWQDHLKRDKILITASRVLHTVGFGRRLEPGRPLNKPTLNHLS